MSGGPVVGGGPPDALGTHLLLELNECDSGLLDELDVIETAMVEAAREAGASILGQSFHKFNPRGVTGIVAIAESHLAIHTWPEHGYAAVDVFSCGENVDPHIAAQELAARFESEDSSVTEFHRGVLREPIKVTG